MGNDNGGMIKDTLYNMTQSPGVQRRKDRIYFSDAGREKQKNEKERAMGYITVNGVKINTTNNCSLVNPQDWNEAVAEELARIHGISRLTAEHFSVIRCLRSLNGEASDMYAVSDALRKIIAWKKFKELFHRGLNQAFIISGCEIP